MTTIGPLSFWFLSLFLPKEAEMRFALREPRAAGGAGAFHHYPFEKPCSAKNTYRSASRRIRFSSSWCSVCCSITRPPSSLPQKADARVRGWSSAFLTHLLLLKRERARERKREIQRKRGKKKSSVAVKNGKKRKKERKECVGVCGVYVCVAISTPPQVAEAATAAVLRLSATGKKKKKKSISWTKKKRKKKEEKKE